MFNLLKRPAGTVGALCLAGLLAAAPCGFGQTQRPRIAQPGTVNYVEGQVTLDGATVTPSSIGSMVVTPNQQLKTANGKVEMLLTPGVFLRLGPNSAVKMISPSITDTRVQLTQGEAMMEVAQYLKENHIQIDVSGANTTVDRNGIYEFTANPAMARVFDGKLSVVIGDRTKNLEKGDQLALDANNPKLKTADFDLRKTESADDLYAWSKLRADYTAQANMSAAEMYGPGYGAGWYGAGWYWDPYFSQYAFLLGDGFLWDPFGFGFFSPGYWGLYGGYFGYGYGHGFYGRPGGAITRGSAAGAAIGGGFHGANAVDGGFHGASAVGGSFHGGAVGGGFGGGFHGGGGGRR